MTTKFEIKKTIAFGWYKKALKIGKTIMEKENYGVDWQSISGKRMWLMLVEIMHQINRKKNERLMSPGNTKTTLLYFAGFNWYLYLG